MARPSRFSKYEPLQIIGPLVDGLGVILAGLCVYRLRFGEWQLDTQYGMALLAIAALVTLACAMNGAYQQWRSSSFPQVLMHLLLVWLGIALVVMSFLFLAHVADRY